MRLVRLDQLNEGLDGALRAFSTTKNSTPDIFPVELWFNACVPGMACRSRTARIPRSLSHVRARARKGSPLQTKPPSPTVEEPIAEMDAYVRRTEAAQPVQMLRPQEGVPMPVHHVPRELRPGGGAAVLRDESVLVVEAPRYHLSRPHPRHDSKTNRPPPVHAQERAGATAREEQYLAEVAAAARPQPHGDAGGRLLLQGRRRSWPSCAATTRCCRARWAERRSLRNWLPRRMTPTFRPRRRRPQRYRLQWPSTEAGRRRRRGAMSPRRRPAP